MGAVNFLDDSCLARRVRQPIREQLARSAKDVRLLSTMKYHKCIEGNETIMQYKIKFFMSCLADVNSFTSSCRMRNVWQGLVNFAIKANPASQLTSCQAYSCAPSGQPLSCYLNKMCTAASLRFHYTISPNSPSVLTVSSPASVYSRALFPLTSEFQFVLRLQKQNLFRPGHIPIAVVGLSSCNQSRSATPG